jgi:hypothetical protein
MLREIYWSLDLQMLMEKPPLMERYWHFLMPKDSGIRWPIQKPMDSEIRWLIQKPMDSEIRWPIQKHSGMATQRHQTPG